MYIYSLHKQQLCNSIRSGVGLFTSCTLYSEVGLFTSCTLYSFWKWWGGVSYLHIVASCLFLCAFWPRKGVWLREYVLFFHFRTITYTELSEKQTIHHTIHHTISYNDHEFCHVTVNTLGGTFKRALPSIAGFLQLEQSQKRGILRRNFPVLQGIREYF